VSARLLALCCGALALAGCERAMRDMYDQPKYKPGDASPLFDNRLASRPPPAGAVMRAKGELAAMSSGRLGADAIDADARAAAQQQLPAQLGRELLLRGRERFDIDCTPCHSALGDGHGRVVQRGFPAPPSFHSARLIEAPDRHFYDVISDGYGVMVPYRDRVAPADRWAIVAYIRALQLSQRAPIAALPPALRDRAAHDAGVREQR
jgi:mono/diheme cytochrome c family protein